MRSLSTGMNKNEVFSSANLNPIAMNELWISIETTTEGDRFTSHILVAQRKRLTNHLQ